MTTCPPCSKKSQISCSHPSEVFLRSSIVSALFSPTCEDTQEKNSCYRQQKGKPGKIGKKRIQHLMWNNLVEVVALLQRFCVYNHPKTPLASWLPSIAGIVRGIERYESCLVLEVQLWWLESFRHETEAQTQWCTEAQPSSQQSQNLK